MANLVDLVKHKLKIDEHENELVEHYIASAKESIKQSGVKEQENPLYDNAVLIQVLLDYENQDNDLNVGALNNALQSIILQLKDHGGDDE